MISFIHRGGMGMASYRYRAIIPARELGAKMNDLSADTLIFAKPAEFELAEAEQAKQEGKTVIVDFCDDHFEKFPHYEKMARLADMVTCPTAAMERRIPVSATVIPDPYEFDELDPHCRGKKVLWFGHGVNFYSVAALLPKLQCPIRIVSNVAGAIPWSHDVMIEEFARADIVIIPATARYKSANRAVEAIRQGCFVVAEPHPSIDDFPGIWIGDIKEGVEWANNMQQQARDMTKIAQVFVKQHYSPQGVASAWKIACEKAKSRCILDAETATGTDG